MYNINMFLDDTPVIRNRQCNHLPRVGDIVRVAENIYTTVTEVVWFMDKSVSTGQIVHLKLTQVDVQI